MKNIDYIVVRVGLKVLVLFEDDFIDHNVEKTIKYLHCILYELYDENLINNEYRCHDFL